MLGTELAQWHRRPVLRKRLGVQLQRVAFPGRPRVRELVAMHRALFDRTSEILPMTPPVLFAVTIRTACTQKNDVGRLCQCSPVHARSSRLIASAKRGHTTTLNKPAATKNRP